MARGNDPQAAREFAAEYGASGNAEELIRAHKASISPEVSAASLRAVNNEATAELDLDSLAKKAGVEEVVAAAVRGNAIVYVDQDGRKGVLPANDRYRAPKESPADAVVREQSAADLEMQDAVTQHRAKLAQQLAEEKERLDAEVAEELQKLREDHAKRIADAAKDAEKEAEKAAKKGDGPAVEVSGAGNDPSQGGGAKTKSSVDSKKGKGKS
jgi:hypothetical protein